MANNRVIERELLKNYKGFPKQVKPLFHTPLPNRELKTRLNEYVAIAKLLVFKGNPFHILLWQAAVISMLTIVNPNTNQLQYREFGISVTRQQGKSTLMALIVIHHLLTRPQAKIVSIAGGITTARVIFDIVTEIIESSPLINKHFILTKEEITCTLTEGTFIFRATNLSTLGQSPTLVLVDERLMLSDRKGKKALNAIRGSQGAIPDALMISTSTVGDNTAWEGPWGSEFRRAEKMSVKDWDDLKSEDKTWGYVHYGLPEDVEFDDVSYYPMCAPALIDGIGSKDILLAQLKTAEENMELSEFAMYMLGIWSKGVNGSVSAFDIKKFYAMETKEEIVIDTDSQSYVGVDASATNDHTCVVVTQPIDGKILVKTIFKWEPKAQGDIMPIENLINFISQYLEDNPKAVLGYDPYRLELAMLELAKKYRRRIFNIPQNSHSRMASAANIVMKNVMKGVYVFNENDPIKYYASNTVLNENGVFTKSSRGSKHKIDGIIALTMAEYIASKHAKKGFAKRTS